MIDVSEPPLKQQQIALAPLDTSGTEEEQRERNTLLAAARDLQPENMTYLNKLATTESSVELLNLEKEMPEPLRRLLYGEQLSKAIHGQVGVDVATRLLAAQGSISRRIQMSFNGGNNPPPERVGKQVLHVLRARLGKVNGAHLIDLDGEWSVNDPLKAFKKMDDGLARFSQFIQALGHAWCLSHPPATSSIIVVTRAITDMANKAFAGGADKDDVWRTTL